MSGFFIFIGGLFVIAAGAVAFSVSLTDIVIGVVVSGVGIGLLLIAAGVIIARLATLERQILQLHYKDGNENRYTNRAANVAVDTNISQKNAVSYVNMNNNVNMDNNVKYWKCTCGRILPAYVTSCVCGKTQREVKQQENSLSNDKKLVYVDGKMQAAETWKCACGRENAKYVSTCSCGKNKRDLTEHQ